MPKRTHVASAQQLYTAGSLNSSDGC
ncbi:uncharacterized protein CPUR_05873 [Claviceps purpurea 20.1]|uniref:Uncharacterized protein n=1 Tax=Claviceps purpurea (strain 20.1) TaxID=1111077 RepID=M1W8Q7_CLAP2|nr:uncharacterized protein CPUR_05873 [Claviceps purpurea 20.1]